MEWSGLRLTALVVSWLLFVMGMVSSEAFRFRSGLSVHDMFDPAVGDRLEEELKNRDRYPAPVAIERNGYETFRLQLIQDHKVMKLLKAC